jgi:glycosyl transferase family 2
LVSSHLGKKIACTTRGHSIAVLVPCHNEATTIRGVVRDFHAALPTATIYVYDNNSTDGTAAMARATGTVVRHETLQGKGNVVRRMFADIEADIYVLVDGDGTYDAASAPLLVEALLEHGHDMVNGARRSLGADAFRLGHGFGNVTLTAIVGTIFGRRIDDLLSGYRVFTRRFVKSFPAISTGFEIETELTVHALELRMSVGEQPTPYRARPENSTSKLHTLRDGWRILKMIVYLLRTERPLAFFGLLSLVLAAASPLLGLPVVAEYLETGTVPRLPTAILATGVGLLSFMCLGCGLTLDTVTHGRRELKRLHYLSIPMTGRPVAADPDLAAQRISGRGARADLDADEESILSADGAFG